MPMLVSPIRWGCGCFEARSSLSYRHFVGQCFFFFERHAPAREWWSSLAGCYGLARILLIRDQISIAFREQVCALLLFDPIVCSCSTPSSKLNLLCRDVSSFRILVLAWWT